MASQGALVGKNPTVNAGDTRDVGLISGLGRCPGLGNSTPLKYSCLENSMGIGAWQSTQSMGSQTVRHDWVAEHAAHERWERKKMMPTKMLKRSPVLMLTNFSISFPDSSLNSRNTFIDISPVFQICLFGEGTINFHESSFKFEDYFLNTVTEFHFCLMTLYLLRAFIGDSWMDFSCT